MSEPSRTEAKFTKLPDEALAKIALQLHVTSLISFASTCKHVRHVALADAHFQARLRQYHNVRIEALPENATFLEIYSGLHKQSAKHDTLRFQAVSTDGGVDRSAASRLAFWVDNMFAPGIDGSYCSEVGQPVTTLGLLLAEEPKQDLDRRQRVRLARLLLEQPLEILRRHVPEAHAIRRPLKLWSLSMLENFVSELWGASLDQSGPWLQESFDIAAEKLGEAPSDIKERTRILVRDFRLLVLGDGSVLPDNHETQQEKPAHLRHPVFDVNEDPENPRLMYDTRQMPLLLRPPLHLPYPIAIISRICVSRKGEFSCPVRTGAVLACLHLKPVKTASPFRSVLGELESFGSARSSTLSCPPAALSGMRADCAVHSSSAPLHDSSRTLSLGPRLSTGFSSLAEDAAAESKQIRNGLKHLIPAAAHELQLCRDFAAVQHMVANGTLPPIAHVQVHRTHLHFCAVTIEFEMLEEGCAEGLSPVIWFQFFTEEEDTTLQAWETAAAWQEGCSGADMLPQRLQWVTQFCSPVVPMTAAAAAEPGLSGGAGQGSSAQSGLVGEDASGHAAVVDPAGAAGHADGTIDSDGEGDMEPQLHDRAGLGTHGRNKFGLPLAINRPCNLVSVLLIDQENLMQLWEDSHPKPNIDISRVTFHGPLLQLPGNTKLAGSR
eukprot:jgi/Ulvmu1/6201/UM028_0057.1